MTVHKSLAVPFVLQNALCRPYALPSGVISRHLRTGGGSIRQPLAGYKGLGSFCVSLDCPLNVAPHSASVAPHAINRAQCAIKHAHVSHNVHLAASSAKLLVAVKRLTSPSLAPPLPPTPPHPRLLPYPANLDKSEISATWRNTSD